MDGPLTPREVEVLKWVVVGKSDWEIAFILGLSQKTVNFHVENVKRKLNAANRVLAVTTALRDGLVPFPPPRPLHRPPARLS